MCEEKLSVDRTARSLTERYGSQKSHPEAQ